MAEPGQVEHRVADAAREPLEDRGASQELDGADRQRPQQLVVEQLGHEAVVARERRGGLVGVGLTAVP